MQIFDEWHHYDSIIPEYEKWEFITFQMQLLYGGKRFNTIVLPPSFEESHYTH